ncbi:MAG: nitroreductase family protein [Clostridiales bacterium]|nr:nitroreductase family protein [Clostridiales bacterium]
MTNEEYIKAIAMRTSRRTYKNSAMGAQTKEVIKTLADWVNENAGLHFVFIEDATFAFTMFSGKFSAIALCGKDTIRERELCGYWGETIVLQAAYHGLGTCWVTGSYNENKMMEYLKLPKGLRLYCVITVGLVNPAKSTKEKIIHNITHKTCKPYQKMFAVCDEKLPDEFAFAMRQVEAAPSSTNRRCVQFKYENKIISASVEDPYSDKSIELGIAQLHFMLGASAKGVKGRWQNGSFAVDNERILKFPQNTGGKTDE